MATYKYLPLNNEQQIEILERARDFLILYGSSRNIDNTLYIGLCSIIVFNCSDDVSDVSIREYGQAVSVKYYNRIKSPYRYYSLTKMANAIIPMFTRENAILSNTSAISNNNTDFWWTRDIGMGAVSNRIDFLNWLIEKLKLQ